MTAGLSPVAPSPVTLLPISSDRSNLTVSPPSHTHTNGVSVTIVGTWLHLTTFGGVSAGLHASEHFLRQSVSAHVYEGECAYRLRQSVRLTRAQRDRREDVHRRVQRLVLAEHVARCVAAHPLLALLVNDKHRPQQSHINAHITQARTQQAHPVHKSHSTSTAIHTG